MSTSRGPRGECPTAWTLNESSLLVLREEVGRARLKFPGNRFLLTALMEEVGELAAAILQRMPKDEIEAEAVHVACVAMRIYEESDSVYETLTDKESKP